MPEESNLVPPYVSWGVFRNTIEKLAETAVPTGALDRRVLDWLSGADHGALMSGLRFLGLVDSQRKATAEYVELVESLKDTQKFTHNLKRILDSKYLPITGEVNLEKGTRSEIEKAFKGAGVVQGQMLTKSIRFFVKAFTEGGVKVSPYILKTGKPPKSNRTTAPKIKRSKPIPQGSAKGSEHTQEHQQSGGHDEVPKGFARLPIPGLPNAYIQYPIGMTEQQFALFNAMVGVLKIYVSSSGIGKENQT